MRRQIWTSNLSIYFREKANFIGIRHAGYAQEVVRIEHLTLRAQEHDVHDLICYLRPWNIKKEGNWIGREWLRLLAMQSLCYLAAEYSSIATYLRNILTSSDPEWRAFDPDTRESWEGLTDSSCLADPYADFLRCLKEVMECISSNSEHRNGISKDKP